MKIVDRETFLKMPPNTIFAVYDEDLIYGAFRIKGKTIEDDYYFQSVFNAISEGMTIDEYCNIIDNAENNSNSLRLYLNHESRESIVFPFRSDRGYKFVIYENQDIIMLIERLKECLDEEKTYNTIKPM